MSTFEEFRRDFFTLLNASVMAEREGCAKLAEERRQFKVARLIRDRPPFQFPPITLDLKATNIEPRRRRQVR
jgi:hypothetical protein